MDCLHFIGGKRLPSRSGRSFEGRPIDSFRADDDLEEAIRRQCAQYFHPVGTCRMGPTEDPRSVVDSGCRVIGVDSLYVVDASIMPEIVRCNTNATTIMVAEKAAEMLKRA